MSSSNRVTPVGSIACGNLTIKSLWPKRLVCEPGSSG